MLRFILLLLCLGSIEARRLISLNGIFDRGAVQTCRLPAFPENGGYTFTGQNGLRKPIPGGSARRNTILNYFCDNDFDSTAPSSTCISSNTWSAMPECKKRCFMPSSPTVNFKCFFPRNVAIPCSEKLRSGTIVLSSCKEGRCTMKQNLASLTCRNGSWDEKTPECDACTMDAGRCGPCSQPTTPRQETSTQPITSTTEAVHQVKLTDLVERNAFLESLLAKYNSSVREQLGTISGKQADMAQMHLMQEIKINESTEILKKQREEIAQLRSELELLKTAPLRDDALKILAQHNSSVQGQLSSISGRQTDMAQMHLVQEIKLNESAAILKKQKEEIIQLKSELESLKTAPVNDVAKILAQHNSSVQGQLSSISGRQTDMAQIHLVQETMINQSAALLKKQKEEISRLRSELESLKTAPVLDTVKILAEHNSSVQGQLSTISGKQTDMAQTHLAQETKLNEGAVILKKQKEEISRLRAELESLKAAPVQQHDAVKHSLEVLKSLKSELDLFKAAHQIEVTKQKQENSKLREEVASLKTLLLQEIAKHKADDLNLLDSDLALLQSVLAA